MTGLEIGIHEISLVRAKSRGARVERSTARALINQTPRVPLLPEASASRTLGPPEAQVATSADRMELNNCQYVCSERAEAYAFKGLKRQSFRNKSGATVGRFNNFATGCQATAHFRKRDASTGVALPADYALIASDNGVHTFVNGVTLVTPSE